MNSSGFKPERRLRRIRKTSPGALHEICNGGKVCNSSRTLTLPTPQAGLELQ